MAMEIPIAPTILTLPDGATPERWDGEVASMPMPDGVSKSVWEALCQRMMTDIHRNHMMTPDEKEQHLRILELPIPGDPPGRMLSVVEDPTGVYAVGATGSVLWPAALTMIEKLDTIVPSEARHLKVVELGAGLGCVGTFLRRHKGCDVVMTDVIESLPLLQRNVDQNFLDDDRPEIQTLRWGDAAQLQVLTAMGAYDLVVGTDITYRPEHIDELLHSISVLLKPGGLVHIALQDRPGEAECLRKAVERSKLHITSSSDKPLMRSNADKNSALEEGTARWGEHGSPDLISRILVFELEHRDKSSCSSPAQSLEPSTSPGLPLGPDEVEAEFFRLTGIKPDSSLRPSCRSVEARCAVDERADSSLVSDFLPPPRRAPAASSSSTDTKSATKAASRSKDMKSAIVKDYLDRGLGCLLCEMDEDVQNAIEALRPEDRPRSDDKKKLFAEDFYRRREEDAKAAEVAFNAPPPFEETTPDEASAPESASTAPTAETTKGDVDKSSSSSLGANTVVKSCVPGLEWSVDVGEDGEQLSATVVFREEVWEALQGSSSSSKSFREAVSFELSEQELRVTYMGSAVLELRLPRSVDPAAAAAKLSSKLRRVIVSAPLV